MGNFSEYIVNQRFEQVFENLFHSKKIKGKSDLANQLDTYNHVINNILKGERRITVDQINKLCELFDLNANYMFGVSNDMYLNDESSSHQMIPSDTGNILFVATKALAGHAIEALQADDDLVQKRFSLPGLQGDLIAIEISGDSMYPTLVNGDVVICEAVERGVPIIENGLYVIVSEAVVAKRVQPIKSDGHMLALRLHSDNTIYPPYEVAARDVKQLLKVKCRVTKNGVE